MKTLEQICGNIIANQIKNNDRNLTKLVLIGRGNNDIDDQDVSVLVKELEKNKNIIELNLSENSITAAGVKELVKLENITKLKLIANNIGDAAVELLANMSQLKSLDISGNNISNIDLLLEQLSNLEFLYAGDNNISNVSIKLIKSKNLKVLYLDENLIKKPELLQTSGTISQEQIVYAPLYSILSNKSPASVTPRIMNHNIADNINSLKTMASELGVEDKLYLASVIMEELGLSDIVKQKLSVK